jgi:alkylation response protein AidB-like acyl-CoA dehydrogenase
VLAEIERLAREDYAASYVDQDRIPLELVDGEVTLPESVKASVRAFREGGWDRLGLPEEMGGMEVPPSLSWAAMEMLLAANTTAQFYAGGNLFARVLFEEGTDSQKETAKLWAEKGWAGTMVLTEPDAGSDVGAGTTKAVDQGDGTWHIEGVKRFITGGEHDLTDNIMHLVLARPEGAEPGTKGLSLFLVPKFLFDGDGSLGSATASSPPTSKRRWVSKAPPPASSPSGRRPRRWGIWSATSTTGSARCSGSSNTPACSSAPRRWAR